MKKTFFAWALLYCCSGISAQKVLYGTIANIPPDLLSVAIMDYWTGSYWEKLTILQPNNTGGFFTNKLPPRQAQCRIRMVNQLTASADFLLPGPTEKSDSVLTINLDMRSMDGGPTQVSGYPANDLYFALMSAYHNLEKQRASTSGATPAQVQEAVRSFNRLCTEISKQNPGTFTGDIVANLLYEPQKEDYPNDPGAAGMAELEFAAAHSLDKIPFRSDAALSHESFEKKVARYAKCFDLTKPGGSKAYIDGLMAKRNGSEAVDLYLFKYLLEKMINLMDEEGLQHLLTWYLPDCSESSPLPDYTKTMVQALQNCAPGKTIPEMEWPGADDKPVSLSSVCAKNKLTLLLFWKTNCSHCKDFKPVLAGLYEKYHPMGLEVLALSLDRNEYGWKQTLQQSPSPWINVFIPGGQREESNHLFPVPSTPTLIALDSQRKVVQRLILRDQLETLLKAQLQK